jgi:hypothetical protein
VLHALAGIKTIVCFLNYSVETVLTFKGGSPSGSTPVYYAVWNDGLESVVTNAAASSSASPGASSTASSTASVVTVSGGE